MLLVLLVMIRECEIYMREPFSQCLQGGRDPVLTSDRLRSSDHVCFLSEDAGEEPMK